MDDVVPITLQRLRAADIIRVAGLAVASLGQEYSRIGAVHGTMRRGLQLLGIVDTTSLGYEQDATATNPTVGAQFITPTPSIPPTPPTPLASPTSTTPGEQHRYVVDVELQTAGTWMPNCTCSPGSASMCSHAAALLYQWLAHPKSFTFMPPIPAQGNTHSSGHESEVSALTLASIPSNISDTLPAVKSSNATGFMGHTVTMRGPTPTASLAEILGQLGLSELRGIAREYDIVTAGLNKQQLMEAITEIFKRPEAVRRVATALEKPQRQLLATLALAGGSMTDEDLRGLYERFVFGLPNKLQPILLSLQAKGLLFHTSLNSAPQQRIGLSGSVYDVGWYIPADVHQALHISAPITPFNIENEDETTSVAIEQVQPYSLLPDLLLVGRILNGVGAQLIASEGTQFPVRPSRMKTESAIPFPPSRSPHASAADNVGVQFIAPPTGFPSAAILEAVQEKLARSPLFLRYVVRLLRQADILHKDDGGTPYLRLLPNAARLLLGPTHTEVARDLFELWLTQPGYEELYELQEEGLRLCCRTTPLNHAVLRPGELEAENCEARRWLVALIAQAPREQWINFTAFARFIYRLNPTFLQKRQRLFPSPHWWLEQEEGRPLQPNQLSDWMRAEGHYLSRLIRGPLHWWGITDLALSNEGHLLAFRLTPMAGLLLNGLLAENVGTQFIAPTLTTPLEVLETGELLVDCSFVTWPLIELVEDVTKAAGVRDERLCYQLFPKILAEALSKGKQPTGLLRVLRDMAESVGTQFIASTDGNRPDGEREDRHSHTGDQQEEQAASPLQRLIAQLSNWTASYGRVRLYTDVSLLEVADNLVMRELAATTSVEEQVVQAITPTLLILKKQGMERVIEELKRRGQTLLLHEGEGYLSDPDVGATLAVAHTNDVIGDNTKGMQYGTE